MTATGILQMTSLFESGAAFCVAVVLAIGFSFAWIYLTSKFMGGF
jgi:hypothetical protein